MDEKRYIAAIDSGSTGIRAFLFDKAGSIVAREYERTQGFSPEPGALEHDPEGLWNAFLGVTSRLFASSGCSPSEVAAIGISNQRGSFCLWERDTGKPLINFINWADVRAADTVDRMNNLPKWKLIQAGAFLASRVSGDTMMWASSMLRFTTDHASCRLRWVLDRDPALAERCGTGEVLFGTLDTWFVYKLSGGRLHLTDSSNAASTSLYNPFDLKWNGIFLKLFGIPKAILPEVRDTAGDFGETDPGLFGVSIPIRAVAGDQMAALFGHCCFDAGEVKISQGSGAFVDINVGPKGKVSKRGLFPLIAWTLQGKPTYMLEGYVATAGTLIDWLGQGIGLSDTPAALNDFASQCTDTEGVIFVPTHSGLRFPYFNPRARGTIFGLSLATHRRHVARAVFEGIALRLYDIISGMETDTKTPIRSLKVDGGVSRSDILLQCLADFADLEVRRAPEPDMSGTGAAYLAGLSCGFWRDKDELRSLQKGYTVFSPRIPRERREAKLAQWRKAIRAVIEVT